MGKTVDQKLDEAFEFEVLETETTEVEAYHKKEIIIRPSSEILVIDEHVNTDYETSRFILDDISKKGSSAMDKLIELAEDQENPRAYEVIGTMMKNIVDTRKAIMDIHKTMKELQNPSSDQPKVVNNTQENNYFVGTTAQLQEKIEIEREEKNFKGK